MTLLFDRAQKASWNKVKFPVESIDIVGELRHHVHEYPHRDGGDVEKLGRKLYSIKMKAVFDEGIRAYPQNYPDAIEQISAYAERGISADLVIPMAGTIKVFCTKWPRHWDASRRSGESMELEFLEDMQLNMTDIFLDPSGHESKIASTMIQIQKYSGLVPEVPTSWFDDLMNAVNDLLSIRDQFELYSTLVESKILGIEQMITKIDRAITTPIGGNMIAALVSLWNSVINFGGAASAAARASMKRTYVTPRGHMTILDVSTAIYKTSTKATELLSYNNLEDALDIPRGTPITYYVEATSATL